jgi:predicted nuclease of restriction endonuclease-like RecB superfamily
VRYNAKRVGKYRSKFEKQVRQSMPKVKGVKVLYEKDTIPYISYHIYNPDFTVVLPGGRKFFIEVKGFFRPEDKAKMAAVKKHNPDLDIRFVFSSTSKRNARWCEKHGYAYAVKHVPKEWFD